MQPAQSEMCWIAKYTLDFKDLVLKKSGSSHLSGYLMKSTLNQNTHTGKEHAVD